MCALGGNAEGKADQGDFFFRLKERYLLTEAHKSLLFVVVVWFLGFLFLSFSFTAFYCLSNLTRLDDANLDAGCFHERMITMTKWGGDRLRMAEPGKDWPK
jgi:hypothetical protein